MKVMELLTAAVEQEAADIFLIPGRPFSYKIGGRIICEGTEKIMPDEMDDMIRQIYELAGSEQERVLKMRDDDFSLHHRVSNIFRQRGSLAGVIDFDPDDAKGDYGCFKDDEGNGAGSRAIVSHEIKRSTCDYPGRSH